MLITGSAGQLGRELVRAGRPGWTVSAHDRRTLNIGDAAQVVSVIERERPDVIVNAAAYTAVDRAESDGMAAELVNARGAGIVAQAAERMGARLVHLSTDFVFDGSHGSPYLVTDTPNPINVYGRTKLEGERAVLANCARAVVLRTAWLYSTCGSNFVLTMLRLMSERDSLGVVGDQIGSPTWTRSIGDAIWRLAGRSDVLGLHHWTDAGVASWYDFAVAIQEEALKLGLLQREVQVRPISTSAYPTAARRPPYSVLDKRDTWEALGVVAAHWRASLRQMLAEMRAGDKV